MQKLVATNMKDIPDATPKTTETTLPPALPTACFTLFLVLLVSCPFCFCQVLMATNRIDILDAALLRPGRIDRKIEFPNPNEGSRFDILKIHNRKMNLMRGVDLKKVADKMPVSPHLDSLAHRGPAWHSMQAVFLMQSALVCMCMINVSSLLYPGISVQVGWSL